MLGGEKREWKPQEVHGQWKSSWGPGPEASLLGDEMWSEDSKSPFVQFLKMCLFQIKGLVSFPCEIRMINFPRVIYKVQLIFL